MGKSTINDPFSIAMLVYQRVCVSNTKMNYISLDDLGAPPHSWKPHETSKKALIHRKTVPHWWYWIAKETLSLLLDDLQMGQCPRPTIIPWSAWLKGISMQYWHIHIPMIHLVQRFITISQQRFLGFLGHCSQKKHPQYLQQAAAGDSTISST